MKTFAAACKSLVVFVLAVSAFTGCESTDGGGSTHVSGGIYYGAGLYDPWYYGGYYGDVDVIVNPPDRPGSPPDRPTAPPRPTQPIARPPASMPRPTPMPSIPRAPMPRARAR